MTTVTVISRSLRPFQMAVNGDTRVFNIAKGMTDIPQDFLEKWAEQNWDADVIGLLAWPGKAATKRPGGHELGQRGM